MPTTQPDGVLALPKTKLGPGVLLLHAWWGLNPFFKQVCQRLADEGFVVFAPDLHHGKIATTIPEAEALDADLQLEPVLQDTVNAIDYLKSLENVTSARLGIIGFSLGAFLSIPASAERPDAIGAIVLFYGTNGGDFSASQASYQGHFAESDTFEPLEGVDKFRTTLEQAGRPVTFYTYPGTGHWFFESDRPDAYNAQAAELAYQRTVAFLKETLTTENP